MKKSFNNKLVLSLLMLVLISNSVLAQAVRWDEESAAFPVYNEILRAYKASKAKLNQPSVPDSVREQLNRDLREIRFRAQQMHFDVEITRGSSPELNTRYRLLIEALTNDLAMLKRLDLAASTEDKSLDYEKALDKSEELAAAVDPQDSAAESTALDQVIDRLAPYKNKSKEAANLLAALEIRRDQLKTKTPMLTDISNKAGSLPSRPEKIRSLEEMRIAVLDRAAQYLLAFDQKDISAKDAARIVDLMKYASQAIDDLRDPSIMGGASSALTRFIRRAAGFAKLADSASDPEARKILSGLRDTIGTLETRISALGVTHQNPLKAFDIPGEVAAAIVDTSRKGMDMAAEALVDIGKAIEGDQAALDRLPTHARKIEETLSPQTYGSAMAKALGDRLLDRVPFLRALVKWTNPAKPADEKPLPEGINIARTGGSRPDHPLSRVFGVWHIKIQGRPEEPDLALEGHIVIPGKGYTWNIFRPGWSHGVDVNGMKLSGSRFTMTVPWFWTGDRVFLQLSSDGKMMHGLWISSFHDPERARFKATLTRVFPQVATQRVIRTGWNSITIEYTGTGLPIDDRIHGRGMVEFASPGMYLGDWRKDEQTGAMKVDITHDTSAQPGTKTIWLNGVAYDWQFQK